ncbi:MAG: RDD family protein [Planctomycetota bacterium]
MRSLARVAATTAAVIATSLVSVGAHAQALVPGLSARGSVSTGLVDVSHGWVILQNTSQRGVQQSDGDGGVAASRSVLAHLPPRDAPGEDAGAGGAPAGTAKRARSLVERPEAIAADGARVVLVFPPNEGETQRRVLSLRAVGTALDDVWTFDPGERLDAMPPLEAPGRLRGIGYVEGVLVGLLSDDPQSRIVMLARDGWVVEAAAVPTEARLYADGGVGWLVWREGDRLVARSIESPSPPDQPALGEPRTLAEVPVPRLPDVFAGGEFVWLDAEPREEAVPSDAGTTTSVLAWRPGTDAVRTVGRAELPGPASVAVPLGERGSRLVVLCEVVDEARGDGQVSYHATEVSMVSGDVLYAGPVRRALPVSPEEFRFLAVALVALTAATLLIAVRPGSGPDAGVCSLPDGVSLADPAARAAATLVDLLLASWVVSGLTGLGAGGAGVFGLSWLFDPTAWIGLPIVLTTAAALGTTCESVFGRTPGKALFGCRVVRCGESGVRTPTVGALLLRNLIKWLLPPLTVLSLIDGSSGRHRGDSIVGVAVVSRIPEDGGTEDNESD